MRTIDPKRMTKTERIHHSFAIDAMEILESELLDKFLAGRRVPREWHTISRDRDHRDGKSVKVTIRLDADVVKFFKGIGPGYQPRINKVLRAFMHLKLAHILDGPDCTDVVMRPDLVLEKARDRPGWGKTAEWMAKDA
ncbi:BrnA antitoxin family protein [Roseivivax sediminis]|uniref:BrnA antitoxin of type II toxin-antitoxin system n=1 Tax=Roseivivax sediminis TaxID=936889 RepID=A0A1I1ZPZ3_9RHOB|nr:BrnA antitoxin family protein [Roseivivax sediminis]SFE33428.1 BrnA antitoxin of type II toxin-antitoxin system [Roseivivax sediminis]